MSGPVPYVAPKLEEPTVASQIPAKPQPTEAQMQMATLLSAIMDAVVSGEVVSLAIAVVDKDRTTRNAYVLAPNTVSQLVGGLAIASNAICSEVNSVNPRPNVPMPPASKN